MDERTPSARHVHGGIIAKRRSINDRMQQRGDQVICTENERDVAKPLHERAVPDDFNVQNRNTYNIADVDKNTITLNGTLSLKGKVVVVKRAFFQKKSPRKKMPNFEENQAQTVYRVQGQTLDDISRPLIHI